MIDLSGQWLTWIGSWHLSAWDKEVSGYVASSLVLFTFCMRSMRSLRVIALASNVAFIFFAAVSDIAPVLVLHTILLPVNATRLVQIQLARAEAKRLLVRDSPYMPGAELGSPRFLSAGTLADPASALPLVEREQERVAGLLVANLPSEAATASGNELAVAAPAARKLLTEIEKFLVSLMASRPSADLLQWIAGLHSRNNVPERLARNLGRVGSPDPASRCKRHRWARRSHWRRTWRSPDPCRRSRTFTRSREGGPVAGDNRRSEQFGRAAAAGCDHASGCGRLDRTSGGL